MVKVCFQQSFDGYSENCFKDIKKGKDATFCMHPFILIH